ncbi:tetratricopeptide repeat protein [Acidocella aminolytica]|uniref:Uncharacterized protein n=1 Tax=Acidocella aminolytica 101 = DSM 11237 TaxID=1120923 RepID=A0A0D6PMW7_9PROT|nr:tetratricopeptide repeat protein [Acidocella aminolytica]GAN82129.1 hypothetical protein Aam_162_003 [Acidocella aminolytica 101 = DSM 11237]GBQ41750.1 hypothetical protein AA11237_2783 [Acidocella aminolytica 101 = DSM 11237]SHF52690.1 Tfp pilus assembly protein PilF [Acidocella aminolytica 101 = DSM 11237]
MNDYTGPSVDPTNPQATVRAATELMQSGDFSTAERLLGWALDFNPDHAALQRRMSELRWEQSKADEALDWAEQALAADRGDAENYAYLGLLRARQGRYTDAAELLGHAVEIKPDNPHYLCRLADIMVHLGRSEDAKAFALQATSLQPKNVHNYLFLASLQRRYGDFDAAEATLQAGIKQVLESAALLRRMAEFRLARGDIYGAMRWAERAREAAPNDLANYDLEANLALESGDLTAAEHALRTAASLNNASAHHMRRLSDVLMRRSDLDGALAWAKKAISDYPQDQSGYIHIANLHMAQGQHDAAYAVLEAAVGQAAKPNAATMMMRRLSSIAQQKGWYAQAIDWARCAVEADPFDAENHAHLASHYLHQGDLAAAQEAARLALDLAPGQAAYSRCISEIAWKQGEVETALEWAERAVAAHPADAQNHAYQASLLMQQGQNEAAEPPLVRAVELAPLNAHLLTRASDLKMRLDKQEEAFAFAERAISAQPYNLVGYNHLATLHIRQGNIDAAEAVLRRAAEIEPTNAPVLRRLAEMEQRKGNLEAALTSAEKAIEAAPRDANSYNFLARLHLSYGNLTAAASVATKAVELSPTHVGALRLLSDIMLRQGKADIALSLARQAASANLGDPHSHNQEASVLLAVGDYEQAAASVDKALKLAPTDVVFLRRADYLRALVLRQRR